MCTCPDSITYLYQSVRVGLGFPECVQLPIWSCIIIQNPGLARTPWHTDTHTQIHISCFVINYFTHWRQPASGAGIPSSSRQTTTSTNVKFTLWFRWCRCTVEKVLIQGNGKFSSRVLKIRRTKQRIGSINWWSSCTNTTAFEGI